MRETFADDYLEELVRKGEEEREARVWLKRMFIQWANPKGQAVGKTKQINKQGKRHRERTGRNSK